MGMLIAKEVSIHPKPVFGGGAGGTAFAVKSGSPGIFIRRK